MTENENKPQEPSRLAPQPQPPQPPPYAMEWPPQATAYGPAPFVPKDDIPDKPPVDDKIGKGILSIIPRVLRLRDAIYFDIKNDSLSYRAIGQMALVAMVAFMIYGFIMGTYNHFPWQSISSMIKLPIVFLLSLLVCLLPLYLIGILLNLRMYFRQIVGLFVLAVCATSLVAVCLAPIAAFCRVTITRSDMRYDMIMMVNVVILGLAGFIGVTYVLRGSKFMAKKRQEETGSSRKSRFVLWVWMIVYALVGIQLTWDLRPYMGKDDLEFKVLRITETDPAKRGMDFYSSTVTTIKTILGILPTEMKRRETQRQAVEQTLETDRAKADRLNADIDNLQADLQAMENNPEMDKQLYDSKKALLEERKAELKELLDKIDKEKRDKENLERPSFPSS